MSSGTLTRQEMKETVAKAVRAEFGVEQFKAWAVDLKWHPDGRCTAHTMTGRKLGTFFSDGTYGHGK